MTVPAHPDRLEICLLAGGLSTRMGCDKARIKINGVTMLARIRAVVVNSHFRLTGYGNSQKGGLQPRLRVIRKDAVPRCGPLGGIVTALRTSHARAVLFLACDMPLISPALLHRLFRASADGQRATFATQEQGVGFPFLLPVADLNAVEEQMAAGEFTLQSLAEKLCARRLLVSPRRVELGNVNTPADVVRLEQVMRRRSSEKVALKRSPTRRPVPVS